MKLNFKITSRYLKTRSHILILFLLVFRISSSFYPHRPSFIIFFFFYSLKFTHIYQLYATRSISLPTNYMPRDWSAYLLVVCHAIGHTYQLYTTRSINLENLELLKIKNGDEMRSHRMRKRNWI